MGGRDGVARRVLSALSGRNRSTGAIARPPPTRGREKVVLPRTALIIYPSTHENISVIGTLSNELDETSHSSFELSLKISVSQNTS